MMRAMRTRTLKVSDLKELEDSMVNEQVKE